MQTKEAMNHMILHPEELDRSSFRKLGDFEDLLTTSDTYSGKKTEEGFFPDVLRLSSNGKDTSVSVTKVCGKNRTITSCEIHSDCCPWTVTFISMPPRRSGTCSWTRPVCSGCPKEPWSS